MHQISLPDKATLESYFDPALLGGMVLIRGQAHVLETGDWLETLYRTTPPITRTHILTALPYYAWGNREAGEMRVWIHTYARKRL